MIDRNISKKSNTSEHALNEQDKENTLTHLCEEAKNVFIAEQAVSISLMQRRLKIQYSLALQVMNRLEENGVVSSINEEGIRKLTNCQK